MMTGACVSHWRTFGINVNPSSPPPEFRTFAFASCAPTSRVAVLLFCQCGSDRVDVWNGRRARLRCFSCNHEAWLDGFTVSEFDVLKLLTAAVGEQARKHRKRSPEEVARIQSDRALNH